MNSNKNAVFKPIKLDLSTDKIMKQKLHLAVHLFF